MSETARGGAEEHRSPFGFDDTLGRLVAAIEGAGMAVFARIDHAEGARLAGLSMPPATVLIYGSPKGGTPVMLAVPALALDLPLRTLVRQEPDGAVVVSFRPVAAMLRAAGAPDALAARLEPAQRVLIDALRG